MMRLSLRRKAPATWRRGVRLAMHNIGTICPFSDRDVWKFENSVRARFGAFMTSRTDDLAMRVWFRLIRLEARMQVAITEQLREIGLSVPQCDVLTTLTEAEGVSQQELAKRLYVTKGNISGLLDRLESAGLVERRSTATDRRQYEIYLTAAGRTAADKAIALQRSFIDGTLGRMSDADLLAVENMLIAMRDQMRASAAPGKSTRR